jgi:hypothetical protein
LKPTRAGLAVHIALALLAAWPLAQIALVRAYGVNAWKLAGWGMYAAPQLNPLVKVTALTPDDVGRYELESVHPDWERAFLDFVWRRRGLGDLARPDALGRRLLKVYPAVLGVEITVEQPWLNPRTGMIESESTTYRYERRTDERSRFDPAGQLRLELPLSEPCPSRAIDPSRTCPGPGERSMTRGTFGSWPGCWPCIAFWSGVPAAKPA